MATPHELFRGKAPAAMAQMGAGIADSYARAGAIEGAAYQQLGQTIGGAITGLAGAYKDYKATQSDIKAKSAALDTMMPYLPEKMQTQLSEQKASIMNDTSMSDRDKQAYLHDTFGMAGNFIGQGQKLQQIQTEGGLRFGLAGMQEAAASARQAEQLKAEAERTRFTALINSYNNTQGMKTEQQSGYSPQEPYKLQLGGGGIPYPR
jgi:hypothetical protein